MKKSKKTRKINYYQAIGRRKTATATVRLFKNKESKIAVNDKLPIDYFGFDAVSIFTKPLKVCNKLSDFKITIKVNGGGKQAQIEAIRLGVARALIKFDQELRQSLRKEGFLTRDQREKERKKPGLKRARRAPQWSKR